MLPYMQTLQPWIGFRISERDVQTRVYFQGKPMVEKQRDFLLADLIKMETLH